MTRSATVELPDLKSLYEFIQTITAEENLVLYKELLTYDLYLRENVKKRPDFAGDYTLQRTSFVISMKRFY